MEQDLKNLYQVLKHDKMKRILLFWVMANLAFGAIAFLFFKSKFSKTKNDEREHEADEQFDEVEPSNFQSESGGRTDDEY